MLLNPVRTSTPNFSADIQVCEHTYSTMEVYESNIVQNKIAHHCLAVFYWKTDKHGLVKHNATFSYTLFFALSLRCHIPVSARLGPASKIHTEGWRTEALLHSKPATFVIISKRKIYIYRWMYRQGNLSYAAICSTSIPMHYADTAWQKQNRTGWEELQTPTYPGGEGQYSGSGFLRWFCCCSCF